MTFRRMVALLVLVAAVFLGACGDDEGDGEEAAPGTTASAESCVERWVEAFDALDPDDIEEGFDESSPLVSDAQEACPFDDLDPADQSQVFARVRADVTAALTEAGFIEFQPLGEEVD